MDQIVDQIGEREAEGKDSTAHGELLTHSRLQCFRSCPRKHQLRYEYGLRPDVDSEPLRVGAALAVAQEADAKGLDVESALRDRVEDPFELALVAAIFQGHKKRWEDDDLEVVAAEVTLEIPIRNPDTGAKSTAWRGLAMKLDSIRRLPDGRLALKEDKCTAKDFAPGAPYWIRLQMDTQLSIYVIGAKESGYDLATIVYDVSKRPSLRPLKATPEDARKYTAKGFLYANQRDADETPLEYAVRVAEKIGADLDSHYSRIEIPRTDQDLVEAQRDIWFQQQAIRSCQRTGNWWRNPENCVTSTGQTCEYLPVCNSRDLATRTPQGFKRVVDMHPELAAPEIG